MPRGMPGIKHRDRIEERLRDRLRQDPELAEELAGFFDERQEEPFFVKNLERVQGDERDAIILSIGYGKNDRGDLVYRFGPLLTEGGKRRLNVAVTRAKNRITLVSSFSSRDMAPERSTAAGVTLLRQYLQSGNAQARVPGSPPDTRSRSTQTPNSSSSRGGSDPMTHSGPKTNYSRR